MRNLSQLLPLLGRLTRPAVDRFRPNPVRSRPQSEDVGSHGRNVLSRQEGHHWPEKFRKLGQRGQRKGVSFSKWLSDKLLLRIERNDQAVRMIFSVSSQHVCTIYPDKVCSLIAR